MISLRKFSFRSFDWTLAIAVILLVTLGLAAIYSVDLSRGGGQLLYSKKQLLAAGLGLVLLAAASLAQPTFFRARAKLFYSFSLFLLVLVLLVGRNIRGAKSWFVFGSFSFQPLEFAKIGLIFLLAYIVYNFGRRFERRLFFIGTAAITAIMVVLVALERDLGSSVVVASIWLGIILLVGARRRHLLIFLAVTGVFAVFGWFFLLHSYQKERIMVFLHPQQDAFGTGYNSAQAIIAVGAGQWFGRGLGFGSQSQLRFLPEAQTDFIFSVIAEELGFAGVVLLVVLFAIVLWRLTVIIKQAHDDFAAVTVSGIAVLFFCQFFVNIAANVGLLPITGVTLPLVSYGGSSLIVNLFLVGVAESMVEKKY